MADSMTACMMIDGGGLKAANKNIIIIIKIRINSYSRSIYLIAIITVPPLATSSCCCFVTYYQNS
jgi:hypothetical protein